MMKMNKWISGLTALFCGVSLLIGSFPVLAAGEKQKIQKIEKGSFTEISIKTPEELLEFADQCVFDTYGDNKKVFLENDINLHGYEWKPVPVFGGVFDGQGHAIIHGDLNAIGSDVGFFSKLKKSGVVRNLHIEGNVTATGSQTNMGGLVGVNQGTIENCSFTGCVTGEKAVGGLVGFNEEGAFIKGSVNYARITGLKETGGLAGINEGSIEACENRGEINTNENKDTAEDTGGIAGFVKGTVSGSKNYGTVGYDHVGYNTGGIAGKLNGSLLDCENRGAVYGRKDVGGIAGQFEPHLTLVYEEDTLQAMKKAFDELTDAAGDLSSELNKTVNQGTGHIKNINNQLKSINSIAKNTINTSMDHVEETWNKIDRSLNEINAQAQDASKKTREFENETQDSMKTIRNDANEIEDLLKSAKDSTGENLSRTLTNISNTLDHMNHEVNTLIDTLDGSNSSISSSLRKIKANIKTVTDAMDSMAENVKNIGNDSMKQASDTLDQVINQLSSLLKDWDVKGGDVNGNSLKDSLKELKNQISNSGNRNFTDSETILWDWADQLDRLEKEAKGLEEKAGDGDTEKVLKEIREELTKLSDILRNNRESINTVLSTGLNTIAHAMDVIDTESDRLLSNIKTTVSDTGQSLKKTTNDLSDIHKELKAAIETGKSNDGTWSEDFHKSMDSLDEELADISGSLYEVSQGLGDNLEEIRSQMSQMGSAFDGGLELAGDNLGNAVTKLSDSFLAVNQEVDAMAEETGAANAEVKACLSRMEKQVNLIISLAGEAGSDFSQDEEKDSFITDISDEKNKDTSVGTIANGRNLGKVTADVNAGGVAGIIARELSGDPETDLDIVKIGERSLKSYRYAKAVISGSSNEARVLVKNNYGGGIAGRADLGVITSCVNTGDVENQNGAYTGGIAGYSSYLIRKSYSFCDVMGEDFIGGIAGEGGEISECYALVTIESQGEKIGAVAGNATEAGYHNYFLEGDLAGINGVNYEGQAEPRTYEEMAGEASLPESFLVMKLRFTADGKTVKTVKVPYGEAIPQEEIPDVPEKEGYFAAWKSLPKDKVTKSRRILAEYIPWESTISSGGKKPILLAEGAFQPEASLKVDSVETNLDNWVVTEDPELEEAFPVMALSGKQKKVPIGYEIAAIYTYHIDSFGTASPEEALEQIRVLVPYEGDKNVKIGMVKDGWIEVIKSQQEGSYYVFPMAGEGSFAVLIGSPQNAVNLVLLVVLAGGLVVFLVFLGLIAGKKKKGKKKAGAE